MVITTMETKMKVIQILLVFSQVSQSDIHVRNALYTKLSDLSFILLSIFIPSSDLQCVGLLRACELLEPECLVQMLKAVTSICP